MFGTMHFIYYINRSVATKVDSTYLGYWPTAHSVYVLWREVGAISWRLDHRVRRFPSTPHMESICVSSYIQRIWSKAEFANTIIVIEAQIAIQESSSWRRPGNWWRNKVTDDITH